MVPRKVIIDTDPGIDDIHALLLAFAASPEDLEIELISVSWGNVEAKSCLRNVVSLFHVIQNEMNFRQERGLSKGFKALERSKPLVALGADEPLAGALKSADYFHGRDGLAGFYGKHPHLTPKEAWEHLFDAPPQESEITSEARTATHEELHMTSLFRPSSKAAHLEILDILSANPPDTVDIIAIGPLTTIALAAAANPQCLLRARSLVYMGGALESPGNITPLAEFNIYAEPVAAARVFALSSPLPLSTMPPQDSVLQPYPSVAELGGRRLNIILFPLDITEQHPIPLAKYTDVTDPLVAAGSPLATFGGYLFKATFDKLESLNHDIKGFTLHDPLCVWYVLDAEKRPELWSVSETQDIRIETVGQWSRGACIVDRRGRKDMAESDVISENEVIGDAGGWLSRKRGNKVKVCTRTPGCEAFTDLLLESVYKRT